MRSQRGPGALVLAWGCVGRGLFAGFLRPGWGSRRGSGSLCHWERQESVQSPCLGLEQPRTLSPVEPPGRPRHLQPPCLLTQPQEAEL